MLGCGAPTHFLPYLIPLTFPYISPYLPHTPTHFPTPPLIRLPSSSLPPPTPQHVFLLSPYFPQLLRAESVAKLPCDEVSVAKLLATQLVSEAKLPCGEVTGNPLTYSIYLTYLQFRQSHTDINFCNWFQI